jgi:uncharacterized protein
MDSFNTSPTPPSPPKLSPEQLIRFGYGLGLLMVLGALIWVNVLRGDNATDEWFGTDSVVQIVAELSLGLVVGAVFSLIVWVLGRQLPAFGTIRERLIQVLDVGALRWWHVIAMSLLAAVPEEMLFRGAMQPAFGLIVTSIIFGALHSITPAYFIYATAAGLALGFAFEETSALWLPIAAHFAVDYVSLTLLANWARSQQPSPVESSGPEALYGVADREETFL